jgi:hypothetical protein
MERKRKRFYFIPIFILAALAVLSGIVMLLWNGIVTNVLAVKRITYGQAAGLFILCKILFTSFRPGSGGFRHGGPGWRRKLMNLSPEEREKFKQEWQQRFQKQSPGD